MEHGIFFMKYAISVIMPDVPSEVQMQLARQEFLTDKVIQNEIDDDEDDYEPSSSRASIIIAETDGDWEFPEDGPPTDETDEAKEDNIKV